MWTSVQLVEWEYSSKASRELFGSAWAGWRKFIATWTAMPANPEIAPMRSSARSVATVSGTVVVRCRGTVPVLVGESSVGRSTLSFIALSVLFRPDGLSFRPDGRPDEVPAVLWRLATVAVRTLSGR